MYKENLNKISTICVEHLKGCLFPFYLIQVYNLKDYS